MVNLNYVTATEPYYGHFEHAIGRYLKMPSVLILIKFSFNIRYIRLVKKSVDRNEQKAAYLCHVLGQDSYEQCNLFWWDGKSRWQKGKVVVKNKIAAKHTRIDWITSAAQLFGLARDDGRTNRLS